MLTIFGGIVILGILVFVHELGHFCVAKFSGIKVLKFSLGFGPRLVSRQWGETEYLICAVPLGGYVLMLGEGGGENGEAAELTPEEEARSFAKKSVKIRTAVIAAGPLMNLLLPFVVLPLAFMLGVSVPQYLDQAPIAGYITGDSSAQKAGFLAGDRIVSINGDPVATWETANTTLVTHVGSILRVEVQRADRTVILNVPDGGIDGLMALGILPQQEPVIGALAAGMPAAVAGLKEGDRIVAIDERPVESWYQLKEFIQTSQGKKQTFEVRHPDGSTTRLAIEPKADAGEYLIGIAPQQLTIEKRYAFSDAVAAGWQRGIELIKLTWLFIGKLFTGNVPTNSIGGPISVVQIAGQAAQTDVASVFLVLAFLSIQLGILNLLPIPILDGGHLFFNLTELVLRRPLSLRAREIAQQIGLALLIMLMLLAFYNDITRLVMGG